MTQDIDPQVQIKGVPAIEQRVITEVASYSAQLGKALQALGVAAQVDLPEIDQLIAEVEG